MENYANYSEQPQFDADGFLIVKTKAEMEAEARAAAKPEAPQSFAQEETTDGPAFTKAS